MRSLDLTREILQNFKEISAFKEIGIDDNELTKIILNAKVKIFIANKVLFRTGDIGDYFYIVLHGKIDLYIPNPAVKRL